MKIYHYSRLDAEYMGESDAKLDPIDKHPRIPAFATTVSPPDVQLQPEESIAFIDGAWVVVNDYRNTTWYDAENREIRIEVVNATIDPSWTRTPKDLDETPTADETIEHIITNNQAIKALVLALNTGDFVPGSNYSLAQIKTILKAYL